jgi:hypothetical protein
MSSPLVKGSQGVKLPFKHFLHAVDHAVTSFKPMDVYYVGWDMWIASLVNKLPISI